MSSLTRLPLRIVCALSLTAGALILFNPAAAHASSAVWIGGTGGGPWENVYPTTPGWTNADLTFPDGVGQAANMSANASGGRTVTMDISRTVGTIYLAAGGSVDPRNANVRGVGTLTLDNGANKPTVTVPTGNTSHNTIGVVIAGVNGLRAPISGGRLCLSGANTYTGDTEVQRRILTIQNSAALPSGARTGNVKLITAGNPGDVANLEFDGIDSATINGLNSDTNLSATVGTVPLINALNAPSGTFTLSVGDNDQGGVYDGTIQDGASIVALTKIGAGTLTLNGQNSYTGTTTVTAGTLSINGYIFSPVQVNGGVFGGNGTIYGTVTVGAGGSVGAGNSAGILSVFYGMDLSAGGTNIWELAANSTATPGTDFDQIVSSGTVDLTDSTLSIRFTGSATAPNAAGFWASDHSWLIISSASVTANFKTIENGTNVSGSFYTTVDASGVHLNFHNSGIAPSTPPTYPQITSISGAGTASVTVNYTNTLAGTNYVLRYNTNLSSANWYTAGTKTAAGTSDSQTDTPPVGGPQRYYRVYYQYAP